MPLLRNNALSNHPRLNKMPRNNYEWQKWAQDLDKQKVDVSAVVGAGAIEPVSALPSLPDTDYPIGSVVFLTTDNKLYRNPDDSAWIKAVDGNDLEADSVLTNAIAAGAITASKIATDTITANEIAAGTITATEISTDTITANEISSGTITATEIATDTITANEIAGTTITASEIASNAIETDKINSGAVTADKITVTDLSAISADIGDITAGNIVLNEFIRLGQTGFDSGTGFWLGDDSGTPKFSIGDSTGAKLTWNGTTLVVTYDDGTTIDALKPAETDSDKTTKNLVLAGDSNTHPAVGQEIGNVDATGVTGSTGDWVELRTFTTDFTGTFRLMVEARENNSGSGGSDDGKWRLRNGSGATVHTSGALSTSFVDTFSGTETITSVGETWKIDGRGSGDLAGNSTQTEIRDTEVRARFDHATFT